MEREHDNVEELQTNAVGIVRSSTFTKNTAKVAGGAIFTNRPKALYVSCGNGTKRNEIVSGAFVSSHLSMLGDTGEDSQAENVVFSSCANTWHGNYVRNKDGVNVVATAADFLKVCIMSAVQCGGPDSPPEIWNHTSGKDLETIFLNWDEAFNYLSFDKENTLVKVTSKSENVVVRDEVIVQLNQNTSLSGIRLQAAVDQVHVLKLAFDPHIMADIFINVQIRGCLPGEIMESSGELCVLCKEGTYSFGPYQNCTVCPSLHAICRESIISPEDHYWHSSTKSTQMHKCIVEEGCQYINRQQVIGEQARLAHSDGRFLEYDDNQVYTQCSEVGLWSPHLLQICACL